MVGLLLKVKSTCSNFRIVQKSNWFYEMQSLSNTENFKDRLQGMGYSIVVSLPYSCPSINCVRFLHDTISESFEKLDLVRFVVEHAFGCRKYHLHVL